VHLLNDDQGVEKVGLGFSMSAPVGGLVHLLGGEDPRGIQHDPKVLELFSNDSRFVDGLARELSKTPSFSGNATDIPLSNSAPGGMSHMLVIVHE
jgi:hypothetical protein